MIIEVVHRFPTKFEVTHHFAQSILFNWKVGRPELKKGRIPKMLELSCTNEEKIKVTVNPVTTAGKKVTLDGPIAVSIQAGDGTVVLIDDLSFYVVSGDNPGDTSYLVSGDADLGAGVETISDIVILHVAGAKASNLGLVAGSPELK
jgi:hypothetical protein